MIRTRSVQGGMRRREPSGTAGCNGEQSRCCGKWGGDPERVNIELPMIQLSHPRDKTGKESEQGPPEKHHSQQPTVEAKVSMDRSANKPTAVKTHAALKRKGIPHRLRRGHSAKRHKPATERQTLQDATFLKSLDRISALGNFRKRTRVSHIAGGFFTT